MTLNTDSTERIIRIDERVGQIQTALVTNEVRMTALEHRVAGLEQFKWKAVGVIAVLGVIAPYLVKWIGA